MVRLPQIEESVEVVNEQEVENKAVSCNCVISLVVWKRNMDRRQVTTEAIRWVLHTYAQNGPRHLVDSETHQFTTLWRAPTCVI